MKTGIELIAEERERQISQEGWTPEHDDGHKRGELLDAGIGYIHGAINVGHPAMERPPITWPWEAESWKPSEDPVRNLVKAGALLAAEIDRLQRLAAKTAQSFALLIIAASLTSCSFSYTPEGGKQVAIDGVQAYQVYLAVKAQREARAAAKQPQAVQPLP